MYEHTVVIEFIFIPGRERYDVNVMAESREFL